MEQTVIIYALYSSANNESVRYIGKTVESLKKRLYRHTTYQLVENTHKSRWIQNEINNGNKILIKPVHIVQPNEDWEELEKYYIDHYRKLGYDLTNLTKGGECLVGIDNPFYGKKHTNKTKKLCQLNHPFRKDVCQYSLDGKLIAEYLTIREAARITKLHRGHISKCCNNKAHHNTVGGYVFKFKGDNFIKPNAGFKRVIQIDDKNMIIGEYKSCQEAGRITGINGRYIAECARGDNKSAGGFKWKFV